MSMRHVIQEQADFGLDSYAEDVEAINRFFLDQNVDKNTVEANEIMANEWFPFYNDWKQRGWFDQSFSKDLWNKARNIRDRYNNANGNPTPPGALKAEDLGQAQPIGGLLGDLPSNVADKGLAAGVWKSLPTGAKVGLGVIAGLLTYRAVKGNQTVVVLKGRR